MEVIKSFTIDHTHLKPGIYISRDDRQFRTFDLRITEPNREPAVAPAAMHSIEHLMATWFRNSEVKADVVYVGPMGCLTGMYIVMASSYSVEAMRQLTIDCLQWILEQDAVPATTPETCGNYLSAGDTCSGCKTISTANTRSSLSPSTTERRLPTPDKTSVLMP